MSQFTADDLRRCQTPSEKNLWEYLRAHRCMGYKFRRQHQIDRTIVDFVCLREKLVIELDGEIHNNQKLYDARRDSWLRREGFHVLRFKNEEVDQKPEAVVAKIKAVLWTISHRFGS
jgi:very-short-patch-repair endonuclease